MYMVHLRFTYIQPIHFQIDLSAWSCLLINEGNKLDEEKNELDRMVDRVKPWFMVHGLAHGS